MGRNKKKKRVYHYTVYLTPDVHDYWVDRCDAQGITFSQFVNSILVTLRKMDEKTGRSDFFESPEYCDEARKLAADFFKNNPEGGH